MKPVLVIVASLLVPDGASFTAEELKVPEVGALPVLVFQSSGNAIKDRERIPASLTVLMLDKGRTEAAMDELASGPVELSVRGNSSFYYPKKSYRLELQDNGGKDRKASLMGLPADSDWILYASVTDKTFTRSVLAHELWRSTGRYAVRWRFVEVFVLTNSLPGSSLKPTILAGEVPKALHSLAETNIEVVITGFSNANNQVAAQLADGYMGVYVLMERIKRGKERVSIARLRPEHLAEPEVSGGYIIKKDDDGRGERGLLTGQEFKLRFEEPKEKEVTKEQRQWLGGYLERFEKTLFGREFRNPSHGYQQFLDIDSFIDFHWLVEVARNADGFYLSQYMHKDRGQKLKMGPIWDWDATFGNPFFRSEFAVDGWRAEGAPDPDYTWYRRMFEDPDFLQRYIDRWSELRTNILATSNVLATVRRISTPVREAAKRNEAVWRDRQPSQAVSSFLTTGFDGQLIRLTNWISQRLSWIDNQEYPKPIIQVNKSTGKSFVSMAALNGRMFFTTNGVDPRLSGGGVSQFAIEYSRAFEVAGQVEIIARTKSKFGLWSAPVVLEISTTGIGVEATTSKIE